MSAATVRKRALERIEKQWPGAPVHIAKKTLRWVFKDGERIPRSIAEDLFACLDALVLHADGLVGIQWTDATSASRRRHKVEQALDPLIAAVFAPMLPPDYPRRIAWSSVLGGGPLRGWLRIEVWGWKPRQPFLVWRWKGGDQWERIE